MRPRLLAAVVLLSALALTGCTSSGSSVEEFGEPPVVGADSGGQLQPGAPESAADGRTVAPDGDQQVIVTGYLTLTVERPAETAAEAAGIVERAGGRIDARSEQAPDGEDKGSAQLTVRIPTEKLTATLESLKKLGTVEQVEQAQQDVTSQSRDLEARITALRTSVDRLISLMADADTTADLISIESALSERQANLESLESQKRSLDDQVQMSTYILYLGTAADAPADEPDTFLSGLAAGWDAFVGFFSFLLVAFGVLLPWLVLAGLVAAVSVVLVRRRVKAAPDAPESVEGL